MDAPYGALPQGEFAKLVPASVPNRNVAKGYFRLIWDSLLDYAKICFDFTSLKDEQEGKGPLDLSCGDKGK